MAFVIVCNFIDGRCTSCGAPRINERQICGNWTPGLGDYVHASLASIGITPERVSAALGVDDCGCKKRREAMNEFGRKIGIGTPKEGVPPSG